ncbi:hypothetical protein KFE25_010303 [Diacronema lutheri]|uniref:WW domain-containing protein n=1 Tax=Diacronema lutheri TaxID=2081491 RepID=A0A8J5XEL4_DIALT|nr:hypothetical protein KFE25_010303 [Diacronema lutheri]
MVDPSSSPDAGAFEMNFLGFGKKDAHPGLQGHAPPGTASEAPQPYQPPPPQGDAQPQGQQAYGASGVPQPAAQPPATLESRVVALEKRVSALEAENGSLRSAIAAGARAAAAGGGGGGIGEPLKGALRVHVLGASGLAAKDESGTSDPFVKVTVMEPSGAKSHERTETRARTLAPEWNALLGFASVSRDAVLLVDIYDEDPGDKHDLIGQVRLPISGMADRLDLVPTTHAMIDGVVVLAISWSTDPTAAAEVAALHALKAKPAKVKSDWRIAKNADGREYYWHRKTKEVTWTMPDELRNAQPAPNLGATMPASLPSAGTPAHAQGAALPSMAGYGGHPGSVPSMAGYGGQPGSVPSMAGYDGQPAHAQGPPAGQPQPGQQAYAQRQQPQQPQLQPQQPQPYAQGAAGQPPHTGQQAPPTPQPANPPQQGYTQNQGAQQHAY